jgi:hypothetical protein
MEFVVRQTLQQTQESLQGLYDGNPKRKTDRPSAEQMLTALPAIMQYSFFSFSGNEEKW